MAKSNFTFKKRGIIKMYSYDRIPEKIIEMVVRWYEGGVLITNIIRQINPKIRKEKLPQFDLADFCFLILTLAKNDEINEVKRTMSNDSKVNAEYDVPQIKKFVRAWTDGLSRTLCHKASGNKIFTSYKFGNRLFACLNKKYKIKIVEDRSLTPEKKKRIANVVTDDNNSNNLSDNFVVDDKFKYKCVYKPEDIQELELSLEKLKNEVDETRSIFAEFFSLFRLAKMNSKYPNSFIVFFRDLPISLRVRVMNALPFTYNMLSYPERIELKEFKESAEYKNNEKRYKEPMSLQQAETLYEVTVDEEDKELSRRVLENAYPRLALGKKMLKLETLDDTESRMTIVEADVKKMRVFVAEAIECQEQLMEEIKKADEKLDKAREITLASLRLIKYKNAQEENLDRKAMQQLKVTFLRKEESEKYNKDITEEIAERKLNPDEVINIVKEKIKLLPKTSEQEAEDLSDLQKIIDAETELVQDELEDELNKDEYKDMSKEEKEINKIASKKKFKVRKVKKHRETESEKRKRIAKEKDSQLSNERSVPLSERLKAKMKRI